MLLSEVIQESEVFVRTTNPESLKVECRRESILYDAWIVDRDAVTHNIMQSKNAIKHRHIQGAGGRCTSWHGI